MGGFILSGPLGFLRGHYPNSFEMLVVPDLSDAIRCQRSVVLKPGQKPTEGKGGGSWVLPGRVGEESRGHSPLTCAFLTLRGLRGGDRLTIFFLFGHKHIFDEVNKNKYVW